MCLKYHLKLLIVIVFSHGFTIIGLMFGLNSDSDERDSFSSNPTFILFSVFSWAMYSRGYFYYIANCHKFERFVSFFVRDFRQNRYFQGTEYFFLCDSIIRFVVMSTGTEPCLNHFARRPPSVLFLLPGSRIRIAWQPESDIWKAGDIK